jgi:hypothetical protein
MLTSSCAIGEHATHNNHERLSSAHVVGAVVLCSMK